MARPQTSPILAQLQNAKTLPEQTAALLALKNEVVGHIQKKEAWISLGVLEPIVRALASDNAPAKPNGKDALLQAPSRPLSEEEELKLQALHLIASFANGGPAFLTPLHAARALPAILPNLSPSSNPPRIVVAALRAVTNMADAATLALPSCPLDVQIIAEAVLTPQHIDSIANILAINSTGYVLQNQKDLAIGLLSRLCKEERHQQAVAGGGVLDLLATQLASFAVRDGYVVPGAEELAYSEGLFEVFPEAAAPGAKMGQILDAISSILGDSRYRATRFITSPSILAVFPPIKAEQFPTLMSGTKQEADYLALGLARPRWLTAMEYILPEVLVTQPRSSTASDSPYSTPDQTEANATSRSSSGRNGSAPLHDPLLQTAPSCSGSYPAADVESPVIPWLVHLIRTSSEYDRLMAAALLTTLFRAGLGTMVLRETSLGLLVVPILLQMVAKYDREDHELAGNELKFQQLVLEKAPGVLARLVTDCEFLQKAVVDSNGIKIFTKLLKHVYRPLVSSDFSQIWSPHRDTAMELESSSPHCQLGDSGLNPLLAHRIRARESVLKAIGSIAAVKEEYRKALVAQDFLPLVVESLSEYPRKPRPAKDRSKEKPSVESLRDTPSSEYGTNPTSVIIAACYAVRMLSRSVSILRTAVVDHTLALPVLKLMRHPDLNVQIAATATIINLVVEVSPVREYLAELGLMKILCEHAHSDNPALRLNALWALKHFVDAIGPEMKKACLEQLEPGWLVQLISDDDDEDDEEEDEDIYEAGRKQSGEDNLDEDMDAPHEDGSFRWIYAVNGSLRELDASRSSRLRQVEDYLSTVREAETEIKPTRKAREDDLAIQEQGLDFIRNLIGRPMAASEVPGDSMDVIDYLFSALGEDRLFGILASKLRSKVLHPFARRSTTAGREKRILYPTARIILVVIFILVHIAASIPRHRQLVISQTELLKLLAQQSSNKDKDVRGALCHLVINLTWKENDGEAEACAQRAYELKKLGFHTKMETLKEQDRDLDVRERAKTAVSQLNGANMLSGSGLYNNGAGGYQ